MKNIDECIGDIDRLGSTIFTILDLTSGFWQMLNRLRNTNLKVNLKKCELSADNVSYLGYRLTPDGILPVGDKLKAVQDSESLKTVHQVRQFMGLCNFFGSHNKFCSNYCTLA
jgi:hypothetical protein